MKSFNITGTVTGRFAAPSMPPDTGLRRRPPMMVLDFTPLEQGRNPISDELLADVGDVTPLARYTGLRPAHGYPYSRYWQGLNAKEQWAVKLKSGERLPRGCRLSKYNRTVISGAFRWVTDVEASMQIWRRLR